MLAPGVYPAAVTAMTPGGAVDLPGTLRALSWFRAEGCAGAVLAGTNGEGPSLSAVEKRDLLRALVPACEGFPLVLGVATPSLSEARWSLDQAAKAGAAGALVMPPGYFREAGEEGVAQWFEALLADAPLPVLVYNFPQRTGVALSPETMARLAPFETMAGLKDSSGARANLEGYASALAGTGKTMFVGDETLLLDALQAGWTGTISGAANSVPRWLSAVVDAWTAGRNAEAEAKFAVVRPVVEALRACPQPATHKRVLHRLGVLPDPAVRLPLLPPDEVSLAAALQAALDLNPKG